MQNTVAPTATRVPDTDAEPDLLRPARGHTRPHDDRVRSVSTAHAASRDETRRHSTRARERERERERENVPLSPALKPPDHWSQQQCPYGGSTNGAPGRPARFSGTPRPTYLRRYFPSCRHRISISIATAARPGQPRCKQASRHPQQQSQLSTCRQCPAYCAGREEGIDCG